MNKKIILYIGLCVLVMILAAATVFYSVPYIKLNDWVVFANKSDINQIEDDSEWISAENFKKLRVVESVGEEEFVQLKTKKKIQFKSFGRIDIKCEIYAYKTLKGTNEKTAEYNAEKTVGFEFKDFKWVVNRVE